MVDRGRTDRVGGEETKPTNRQNNQDAGSQRRQRQAEGWTADGRTARLDGDGRGSQQRGARPHKSAGSDGARSEHSALARHEYNLLVLEVTEGGPANARSASSEEGHGALTNREGTEMEEGGDKTL